VNAPRINEAFLDHFKALDKKHMGYMYMEDFLNVYKAFKGYNYDEDDLEAII